MNLRGSIYLGARYLLRHRRKGALLVSAITLALFLPLATVLIVHQAQHHLRSRAERTPLLLGAPGSPLELVFNALYFSEPDYPALPYRHALAIANDSGQLGAVIPIHARFEARDARVVGTSLEYFAFRDLALEEGTTFIRLGDCVLGAETARRLALGPGDRLVTTPRGMFDLAGQYPLNLRVTGVLSHSGTPDDRAVFVDLKTAWVIEGIAHGHVDPTAGAEAAGGADSPVLEKSGDNVALNASVVEYTEITPKNISSFHFHGDPADFPVTAAIVLPSGDKARTILLGRFLDESGPARLIEPGEVMANLFATVFQVRNIVLAALLLIAFAAALIAGMVFALSNRLRAKEFESLAHIGADPASVRILVLFEGLVVLGASAALALVLAGILNAIAPRLLTLLTG